MTHAEANQPVTRGDLRAAANALRDELKADILKLDHRVGGLDQKFSGLDQKFSGLDQKFSGLDQKFSGLDQKFSGLDQKFSGLDQKVQNLDSSVRRIATELTKTQADVREIKATMATKSDVDRIIGAIDSFTGKAQNYDRAAALHGHALTELQVKAEDHEGRIKKLESGPS